MYKGTVLVVVTGNGKDTTWSRRRPVVSEVSGSSFRPQSESLPCLDIQTRIVRGSKGSTVSNEGNVSVIVLVVESKVGNGGTSTSGSFMRDDEVVLI